MPFVRSRGRDVCRFAAELFVGFFVTAHQTKCGGSDMLRREAEMLHDFGSGSRSAVVIDADDYAFVAGPLSPSITRPGFHSDSLLESLRQNAFAIRFILLLEKEPAWHAHDPGLYPIALQFFLR